MTSPATAATFTPMTTPDIHSLARQLAVLEERMNTQQADYSTGWEAIRANMADLKAEFAKRDAEQAKRDAEMRAEAAKRDADLKADAAKRDADYRTSITDLKADAAKRDKDNQRFLIVLFSVFVAIFIGSFVVSNIFP
ncbi:MAG: hypothetical protein GDA52_02220 [Rhodobacteraceae bacterium]|nr:hypothetical protein [Paracoccaceae bacterium]